MSTPLAVGPKPTAAPARMSRAAWQLKLLRPPGPEPSGACNPAAPRGMCGVS